MYRTHTRFAHLALVVLTLPGACTTRSRPEPDDAAAGVDVGPGGFDAGRVDGGSQPDTGVRTDTGVRADTGVGADTGVRADTGVDAGTGACSPSNLGSAVGASVASGSSDTATDSGDRSCSGSGAPDVQFSWTAPSAGSFVFDTGGSDYDTVLEILTACGGTSLACNDDRSADSQSRTQVTLTSGQTVVIVLDGYATGGNYVLNIHPDTAEVCDNTTDDDGDGDVDCADVDCDTSPLCHEANCTNGLDDDHDALIDCRDSDCSADPACDESMHCADHIDNDDDRLTDCDDSDCSAGASCAAETNCTNGLDDDNDGHVDCGDTNCSASCGERICNDTLDNETVPDGAIDCADVECSCDAACHTARAMSCPDGSIGSAVGDGVYRGTLVGYHCGERADASCGSGGRGDEIELSWMVPAAGDYVLDTEDTSHAGGLFDTVLAVRDGCAGTELDCNDDGGTGYLSTLTLTGLTAGQMLVIVIDAYGVEDGGSYTLNIHAL